MYRTISVAILSLVVATAACSGSKKVESEESTEAVEQTASAAVEEDGGEKPPPDQGEGIPWADKSFEQQKAYMGMTVKPRMAELMGNFDPEEFGEVKCSTCHGSNAKKRDFVMPSPDLPKLSELRKLGEEEPEMAEFMKKTVVPEMAALLDMEPYDPATKSGFGCAGCHPQ